MGLIARSFGFLFLGLLLVWGCFLICVIMLKNRTMDKMKQLSDFKAKDIDVNYAIWKKKQEIKAKEGKAHGGKEGNQKIPPA